MDRLLMTAPQKDMPDVVNAFATVVDIETMPPHEFAWLVADNVEFTHWMPDPAQNYVIDGKWLEYMPALRYIITPSTGTTHIDLDACARHGVKVLSLLDKRDALNEITASSEFAWLLIMNTLRRLDVVAKDHWRRNESDLRGHELAGKTLGIIGYGRIGRNVMRYRLPFGMKGFWTDSQWADHSLNMRMDWLLQQSDIVLVSCTLNDETRGMLDYGKLSLMKPDAALVNVARGEIINEADLARLLDERPQMRVGLDVLANEATAQHTRTPLRKHIESGRIVYTRHAAGITEESQRKAAMICLELLKETLA